MAEKLTIPHKRPLVAFIDAVSKAQ